MASVSFSDLVPSGHTPGKKVAFWLTRTPRKPTGSGGNVSLAELTLSWELALFLLINLLYVYGYFTCMHI